MICCQRATFEDTIFIKHRFREAPDANFHIKFDFIKCEQSLAIPRADLRQKLTSTLTKLFKLYRPVNLPDAIFL